MDAAFNGIANPSRHCTAAFGFLVISQLCRQLRALLTADEGADEVDELGDTSNVDKGNRRQQERERATR